MSFLFTIEHHKKSLSAPVMLPPVSLMCLNFKFDAGDFGLHFMLSKVQQTKKNFIYYTCSILYMSHLMTMYK